jgi:hypothetical protein
VDPAQPNFISHQVTCSIACPAWIDLPYRLISVHGSLNVSSGAASAYVACWGLHSEPSNVWSCPGRGDDWRERGRPDRFAALSLTTIDRLSPSSRQTLSPEATVSQPRQVSARRRQASRTRLGTAAARMERSSAAPPRIATPNPSTAPIGPHRRVGHQPSNGAVRGSNMAERHLSRCQAGDRRSCLPATCDPRPEAVAWTVIRQQIIDQPGSRRAAIRAGRDTKACHQTVVDRNG